MLKFFYSPRSRATRILWLLEELGVPYELETVHIKRGDGSGREEGANYRKVHPHAKVPALEHNGAIVYETPAVALYLTDLFPEKKLGLAVGDTLRGPYLTWLSYATGVFEPAIIGARLGVKYVPGMMGWAPADEVEAHLYRAIEHAPYFLGENFSAVDIVLGGSLAYLGSMLSPSTARDAYVARITARPAFKRTQEKDAAETAKLSP